MLDEFEMEQRRQEKRREVPMAASLKSGALAAAREHAALTKRAKATTLCTCDWHTHHNLWDALHEAHLENYGRQLRAAGERVTVDVPTYLRRAGCPDMLVNRVHQGGLDERPTLFAARVYLGEDPERLGVQGRHAQLIVKAQRQRKERRPFLGMFGESDRGKTLAAVYCMAHAMKAFPWNSGATGSRQSFPFAFVRMTELAATLAWTQETRDWLERLKRASMLILDDMGKEHLSPVARMFLFELLDTRYGQGLNTIITSQVKVKEFQLAYDGPIEPGAPPGAIYRRLRERGLILRDAGDAGALLQHGDTDIKKWPRKDKAP